ncbi:MAG TPA: hypothetical protein PKC22_09805 [Rhodocyclaceae bacterium]|nr:hypothetical protein [Rhodocyclaceae bacterium]
MGVLVGSKPDVGQPVLGLVANIVLPIRALEGVEREGAVTLCEGRHHDVLEKGQVRKDLRRLEHAHDAHLVDLVRALAGDNLAVEGHGSRIGHDAPDAHVEKGRLAGAVGPIIAWVVPSTTCRSMSDRACSPPKLFCTSAT